ncbi:VanZ family protein [Salegentibacter sediminis]|uniref:VanZ family protein n=1 Tax=Salegentibacter sediminis TaxID=1930251 RepID=UPI001E59668C|nr:VanZ family protein [Salegentibacter sediminis]
MVARILLIGASLYTLALTIASLVRLGKISVGSFNPTDKFLHFIAYLVLVIIWQLYIVFREQGFKQYYSYLIKISVLAIAFGMLIEVLQGALTSFREPDWLDILANILGVMSAAMLLLLSKGILQRLKSRINLVF